MLPQEVVSSSSPDVLTLRGLDNEKEIQPRQGWEAELPILRGWSPSIPSLWLMPPSLFKEGESPLEKMKGWHLHKAVPTLTPNSWLPAQEATQSPSISYLRDKICFLQQASIGSIFASRTTDIKAGWWFLLHTMTCQILKNGGQ